MRPIAVALSLVGSGLSPSTAAFIGWAGPRGLASTVYAVLSADAHVPDGQLVFTVAAWTVLFSILLHGLTAAPASNAMVTGSGNGKAARCPNDAS